MKVGIVYGGTSSEAETSRKNALAVKAALRSRKYDVCMLEYGQGMVAALRKNKVDIVYLCVQGKHHGDGTLQAILEQEQIPYTGSGAEAAMLINNKILCKLLFEYYSIPTPKWRILHKDSYQNGEFDFGRFGFPMVAKAPSQGGSFGIELIRTPEELDRLEHVFCYDNPILLEEFIEGKFCTVGILEKEGTLETLKCVEGVVPSEKAASEKKLLLFTGEYSAVEAKLGEACLGEMDRLARQVFRYTNARDIARVDFMVSDKAQKPYVLEINAVPGLKRESLLPRAAAFSDIQYETLVEEILLSAWSRNC